MLLFLHNVPDNLNQTVLHHNVLQLPLKVILLTLHLIAEEMIFNLVVGPIWVHFGDLGPLSAQYPDAQEQHPLLQAAEPPPVDAGVEIVDPSLAALLPLLMPHFGTY